MGCFTDLIFLGGGVGADGKRSNFLKQCLQSLHDLDIMLIYCPMGRSEN